MNRKGFFGLFFVLVVLFFPFYSFSQLCEGSLGDPVVNITFGAGNNPGPSLSSSLTNYRYVNTSCPQDGEYNISNSTFSCHSNSWHSVSADHTPNDVNGYMMIVNASYTPGDFYVERVDGLCSETTYEFAAWITNVLKVSSCNNNGIMPNVTFRIETTTGTVLLTSESGNIAGTSSPQWKQYGAFFTTPPSVTSVVIRMTNNAPGGCGNDLLLDDITFRPCGPKATASIGGDETDHAICTLDDSPIVINGSYSGTENVAFQWQQSKDNGVTWADIGGETSIDYTWKREGAGTYLYRLAIGKPTNISIANCRTVSNITTITVYPSPQPSASVNSPVCENDSITFSVMDAKSFAWYGPDNFSSTVQKPVIAKAEKRSAGRYFVKVISNEGCTNTDSIDVVVKTKPVSDFSPISASCPGQEVNFTSLSTTAVGNITATEWQFGDGKSANTGNAVNSFINDGLYTISLVTTNSEGCADTAFKSLVIHPSPVVDFHSPATCEGVEGRFEGISTIKDGTENAFTYNWKFGDGTNSAVKDPAKTYFSGNNYGVQLVVTSANGCVDSLTRTILVASTPVVKISLANSTFCSNEAVTITDNSTIAFGDIAKTTVYWNFPDVNDNSIIQNPSPAAVYENTYPSFGSPLQKTATIKLVSDNGVGCVAETTTTINLNASPQLLFDNMPVFCIDKPSTPLTYARETSGLPGLGIYTGRGISGDRFFSAALAGDGIHALTYTYTASNGCSATIENVVTVEALPEISAGPDKYLLEGYDIVLEGAAASPGLHFRWSPSSFLSSDTALQPRASPKGEITYLLTATSSNGCIAHDEMMISILKMPVVPNAFSPNGDGINDLWNITYLDSYPGCTVDIFDRYGRLIMRSKGYSKPWDGTFNGKPLPVGVYYYIIEPKNGLKPFSGSLTLLR